MLNYLIIFFIFIFIILLFSYINSKKNLKISANWNIDLNNIENFDNSTFNIEYNLIKNNCFENQKHIDNYINQSGFNKIVKIQNPGNSPFSLYQKEKSFYELSCDNSINSKYLLYFYIYLENYDINKLNIERYVKIRMPTSDYSNYLPKIQYNVIKKVNFGNNKNWYYIKISYNSRDNTLDKQIITFNNEQLNSNLYITDISLYKVLDNAPNFIYNKDLICFIDSINYNSNNNILHDLSGNNNDLYLSNIPKKNDDYILLANSKIEGFPSNNLNNDHFTFLFTINKQNDSNNNSNLKENYNNILLSIPGNNNYIFEIAIFNDYIYLIYNNNKIKSNKSLNYYHKSIITILYDGQILNIFNDNLNILSHKINSIYCNKKPILINKNKNLDLYLYNIVVYNRIVDTKELKLIREYFITNQNKNINNENQNPNILNVTFDNIYQQNNINNPLINNYDDKLENFDTNVQNNYEDIYDNSNNQTRLNCVKDCNSLCQKFLNGNENSIDNYKNCIKNCRNVIDSCSNYCNNENTKNDKVYCVNEVQKNVIDEEVLKDKCNKTICPTVYKKDGRYIVYVPDNCCYSNFYTGEKDFGDDIDKARNMYAYNFPQCAIPSDLTYKCNKFNKHCPYIVNEVNPCNTRACQDVNWNVEYLTDLKINNKCKKVISNYCHINYDKDDNCKCWDPKYKNDPKCIKFRKFFENPSDYCPVNSFNIEEHPDINKYIRKDKIPCWGCKIPE